MKVSKVLLPALSSPVKDMVYNAFSITSGIFTNVVSVWGPVFFSNSLNSAIYGASVSSTPPIQTHLNSPLWIFSDKL